MKSETSSAEIALLLSADNTGRIDLPSGSGEEIETALNILLRLEKTGFVTRVEGAAYYRPFVLTPAGQMMVAGRIREVCETA